MNKNTTIGLLVLVIIILALVLLYPSFKKSKDETNNVDINVATTTVVDNTPVEEKPNWQTLLPDITTIIKREFSASGGRDITIEKQVEITGDDIPEAYIYTGDGGAYTSALTIARIKEGKPALAVFTDQNGKTGTLQFDEGASVRNVITAGFDEKKNIVYQANYSVDDTGRHLGSCSITAYKWNSTKEVFEYNKAESELIRKDYCAAREVEQQKNPVTG